MGKTEREKHWLPPTHASPQGWGSRLQPRSMSWTGIEPTTFQSKGQCSNNRAKLSRPGQPFKSKISEGLNFYAHKCLMFTESLIWPRAKAASWPFQDKQGGGLFAWLVTPPHLPFLVTLEMKDGCVRPLLLKEHLLSILFPIYNMGRMIGIANYQGNRK